MDIMSYILEEGLIMIVVLYVLGMFITSTNVLANKWIPIVLLIISLFLTPLLLGGFSILNIIQAILVAAAAVFTDQVIKQTQKREWQ